MARKLKLRRKKGSRLFTPSTRLFLPKRKKGKRRTNALGAAKPNTKFGWLGPIFTKMANDRRWLYSFNERNQIVVTNPFPLATLHERPNDFLNAGRIAVAGNATKFLGKAAWPAVPADTSITLTGAVVFGLRVRISNNINTFKFASYNIQVLSGATVIADFDVQTNQLPLDVIVLTTTSANGLASIIGVTTPIVRFLLATNPGLASGDFLYCESLNMRDIGNIPNAEQACAIGDEEDEEDEFTDEEDEEGDDDVINVG